MATMGLLHEKGRAWLTGAAVLAVVFGVATVHEGGLVLSGDPAARAGAGAYVPFVLWFNFLAGFVYVAAGIGLGLRKRWGALLAFLLAAATLVVFAAFGVHVARGGEFETRTVVAMTARLAVWLAFSAVAYRWLWRPRGARF